MNVLEVYIHELKQHAAMAPCDHTLKRLVLQDGIVEYGNYTEVIVYCSFTRPGGAVQRFRWQKALPTGI